MCCMLYNSKAVLRHLLISEVLAAVMENVVNVSVATSENKRQQSVNRESTIFIIVSFII